MNIIPDVWELAILHFRFQYFAILPDQNQSYFKSDGLVEGGGGAQRKEGEKNNVRHVPRRCL